MLPIKTRQNSDIFDVIIFDVTTYWTFFRKHTSTEPIHVKIPTIVHFDEKCSQKQNQTDPDIFDGFMTSSVFDVTSYWMFFRKHTSTEPIHVKTPTIVHFDEKCSQKQNQTDTDIFDGFMMSSVFDVTSYPTILC